MVSSRKTPSKRAGLAETAPLSPGHEESHVRVLRRFRVVFNAVKAHFRNVEKTAGVGGAQLWALSVVREQPFLGVNDLARAMDVHQSTASNLVKSLIAQNLIVVTKTGQDRRSVQLQLTLAGQQVLLRAPGPFAGVLPQALASLDAQTLLRLDQDLGELIAVLGVDEEAAGQPLGQD